jgi:hypothetical protein
MAAKRLGSCLTNITGTAGQLLRVKSDESGFEFVTPATIPAYTVSNKTIDRAIDCTNSNLDEVANVLGTLIDDLATLGNAGPGTQTIYESGTWSHPDISDTYVDYTVTHNMGSTPDLVILLLQSGSQWYQAVDRDYRGSGSAYYGWELLNPTANSFTARVYRLPGGATIKFRCYKLGTVAAVQPFQWSTSEQVYPFEKASNGDTLYCKEINFGTFPNGGNKSVAHGISGLVDNKVFDFYGMGYATGGDSSVKVPYVDTNPTYNINMSVNSTNVVMSCNGDFSTYSGIAKVIYAK